MKDDFFEWLNDCPTQWFLIGENGDRSYLFVDNQGVENEN